MQYGEWEELSTLLWEFPALLPNVHLAARQTILHVAAMSAAPEGILRRLLEMVDKEFCCQPDKFGDTPLYLVCTGGNPSTIRLLALERPQDFCRLNRAGESPCDKLMSRSDADDYNRELYESDIAEIITAVAGANPDGFDSVNREGECLLHRAIPHSRSFEDFVLLRTLMSMMPELIHLADLNGATPVHRAAREDDEDAAERLKLLIKSGGLESLCLQDSDGRTPLHLACHWDSTREVIETLVASDPSALQVRDTNGMTPLDTFRQFHHSFLAQTDYNGDNWNEETCIPIVDSSMTLLTGSPLRCTDSPSLHDLLRNQHCPLDITKLLIYALNYQIRVQDSNGNLPFHIVSLKLSDDRAMYIKVVEMSLRFHAKACQVSNDQGRLPLELMLRSGKTWNNGMKLVLLEHPAAVLDLGLNHDAMCNLMEKLGKEEKPDALFRLLRGSPELLQ
jgi:ankyrin repeat protein